MHLHLCSQCRAIITVDEGRNCPSTSRMRNNSMRAMSSRCDALLDSTVAL